MQPSMQFSRRSNSQAVRDACLTGRREAELAVLHFNHLGLDDGLAVVVEGEGAERCVEILVVAIASRSLALSETPPARFTASAKM